MSEKFPASINMVCTKADFVLAEACVNRAMQFHPSKQRVILLPAHVVRQDAQIDHQELMMDILATHCNGCELDLQKLLGMGTEDFLRDLAGIKQHLNRLTGKLENGYVPKCAKNGKASYQ